MAVLADGRTRPDGGSEPPFRRLCAGENSLRDRPLREGDVLNKQLANHDYIAGEYSIADMACYPWIVPYERQGQKLEDFPHLKRWFGEMQTRPAVVRAYERAKEVQSAPAPFTPEEKAVLFGQTADVLTPKG